MDPTELAGVSVGSLGHIYKKTFKELYATLTVPDAEEETSEEDRAEEAIPANIETDAAETSPHAQLSDDAMAVEGDAGSADNVDSDKQDNSPGSTSDSGPGSTPVVNGIEAETNDTDGALQETSENVTTQDEEMNDVSTTPQAADPEIVSPLSTDRTLLHKTAQEQARQQQVQEIEESLTSQNQVAERLSEFLTERKLQAEDDDKQWASDLYRQGLQAKAEYPWGPSLLKLSDNDLQDFGHFRRHLIMAENLMQENERANMYRRGQLGSRNLDKTFEVRPSTPNYLRTTATQQVRLALNLGKRKHVSAAQSNSADPQVDEQSEEHGSDGRNDSDTDASRVQHQRRAKQRKKREGLTTEQLVENGKVLKRMQNQLAFLRNPRYDKSREINQNPAKPLQHLMLEGIVNTVPEHDSTIGPDTCFHVPGGKAEFTDYEIGQVYETSIKLHNVSNISRRVRVLPPTTKYFSISLLLYPSETGAVAPGMACMVKIRFSPESLGDYHDYLTVLTENNTRFRVPIEAFRDPPSLSIPAALDCGCCLGGNRKQVVFHCENQGGAGRFRLLPASEWPATSAQSYAFRAIDIPPFRVTPSEFSLNKGESVDLHVDFTPKGSGWGDYEEHFVMICDNCRVKRFAVKGTSCQVKIHITALGDTLVDSSIPFIRPPKLLSFGAITIGNVRERVIRINNATPIELSFHWVLYEQLPTNEHLIPDIVEEEGSGSSEQQLQSHHHHHHHHHHGHHGHGHHGHHHHHHSHHHKKKKLIPAHMSSEAKDIFVISPQNGKFMANGSLEFTLIFNPRRAAQYTQIAKLVIEDIPPTSVEGVRFKKRRHRGHHGEEGGGGAVLEHQGSSSRHLATHHPITGEDGGPASSGYGDDHTNIHPSSALTTNVTVGREGMMDSARRSEYSHGESHYGGDTHRTKNTDYTEVATELQLMNITCLELTLLGTGVHPHLDVLPRFVQFPGTLLVRKSFTETVRLSNQSLSDLEFEWGTAELLSHTLDPKLAKDREWLASFDKDKLFRVDVSCRRGTLASKTSLLVDVEFTAYTLGRFDVAVACSYSNGPEHGVQVRIQADVDGPVIRLSKPEIDFGLVSVNERTQFALPFQNMSECPVEYRFEALAADPTGSAIIEVARSSGVSSTANDATIVSSLQDKKRKQVIKKPVKKLPKTSNITFEPSASGVIGPLERGHVMVTCQAGCNPERVRNFIVCHVLDGERRFLAVRGEIQSPKVYVDVNGFELGTTYVSVPVVRRVRLVNLSNLQASFVWSQVGGPDEAFDAKFEPVQGTLLEKGEQVVTFTFVSNKPGRVSCLFACDVEGMKGPIGFSLKTVSRGLVVTYSLVSDDISEKAMALEPPLDGAVAKVVPNSKIPILDFGDALDLCTRKRMRLCLQNHSAIPTDFELAIKSFAASSVPLSLGGTSQSTRKGKTEASRPNIAGTTSRVGSGGGAGAANSNRLIGDTPGTEMVQSQQQQQQQQQQKQQQDPASRLLGDSHEILGVYKSEAGKAFVNRKLQQSEDRDVLGENQGVAFLATRLKGKLLPWRATIIDLWCFNNLPGRYKDELVCNVRGVPQSRVPIRARVVGCPLTLSRNTVGLNLNGAAGMPRLQWGQVVRNTETVHKVIKVVNSGPMAAQVSWRIEANRGPRADVVMVNIGLNTPESPKKRGISRKGSARRGSTNTSERRTSSQGDPRRDSTARRRSSTMSSLDSGEKRPETEPTARRRSSLVKEPTPQLVSVKISPHAELTKAPPFFVEPASQCIPAFGEASFRVSYQPSQDLQHSHAIMIADGEWIESRKELRSITTSTRLSITNSPSRSSIRDATEASAVVKSAARTRKSSNRSAGAQSPMSVPQVIDIAAAISDPGPVGGSKQAQQKITGGTSTSTAAGGAAAAQKSAASLPAGSTSGTNGTPNTPGDSRGRARREPMKNCLRLALSGASIQPMLSLDCPTREDGLQHITFAAWSTCQNTDQSFFKSISMVNRTAAWLPCALSISSPSFVIHQINSNAIKSGLTDADLACLGVLDEQSEYDQVVMCGDDTRRSPNVFNLAPGTSVTVCVRFTPSNYRAARLDVTEQIEQSEHGELVVRYANAEQQIIKLEGTVLQALVLVKPAVLDFTRVHVEKEGRTTLYMTNPTTVDAQWHLEHVPKPTSQHEVDDPFCWAFSPRQGVLGAQSLPLECRHAYMPQGLDSDGARAVLKLKVRFRPSSAGSFKSRFRIVVANGRSVEVLLKGVGSYEEEDDDNVKRLPAPMVEYDWMPTFGDVGREAGEVTDVISSTVSSLGFANGDAEAAGTGEEENEGGAGIADDAGAQELDNGEMLEGNE